MAQKLNINVTTLRRYSQTVNKENDKVLDDIERFMTECENMSKVPNPHIRRIYDDVDLLSVLDTDSEKYKKNKNQTNKTRVDMSSIPPKKRKLSVHQEETKKKTTKVTKSPVKKKVENNSGRVKARKVNKAEIREISEPKFITSKELLIHKKRKIKRTTCPSLYEAVVTVPETRCDTQLWKSVSVKKEVIDLTGDGEFLCTYLKFGKISHIETSEAFEITTAIAKSTVEDDFKCKVNVFVPKVEFHVCGVCVDLTTETNHDLIAISEKECAGRILQNIYNYHKIYEANQKMEYALQEIEECLSPEEVNDDYELTFSLLSKHTDTLGWTLVDILSKITVRNLNLTRFLDILTSKLKLQYDISIPPKTVCFYLFSMLNQNNETPKHRQSKELLDKINEYLKAQEIKRESEGDKQTEGFTEEQLKELLWQIQKYNELAIRQEQLMAVYNEQLEELGLPVITREVKEEMLTAHGEHPVKSEGEIICILDD